MTPKRMDGYVRVSRVGGREGPGYISPDLQRDAIQRWAEYKGVEIAAWHVDEDYSGGRRSSERPGLATAIGRALGGETDGIVSWKIDRFSRFTEDALGDLRRLEEADARLAFVVEDVDTSGPMGKFVYTVMLAMSEYFLDSIKAGWITAKTRAVDRGAEDRDPRPTDTGTARTGVLESHPETAGVVRETFRLAARDGFDAALAYAAEHGVGRRSTTTTLRRLLRNRVYLGEARYGELVNEDAHEALVTSSVWAAAQPGQEARRRPRRTYPLSGSGPLRLMRWAASRYACR